LKPNLSFRTLHLEIGFNLQDFHLYLRLRIEAQFRIPACASCSKGLLVSFGRDNNRLLPILNGKQNINMPDIPKGNMGKWDLGQIKEKRVWAAKIDERGRTTIPKDLLELLQIDSGDVMAFVKEGEGPVYVGKAKLDVTIPFSKSSEREHQG